MAIDLEDDIVQDFLVESREILDTLSAKLVDLEQQPGDKNLLNEVFRGFHTIKGGAGFLGMDPLVEVCHRTEDVFNLLRNGEKSVDADLMDTVLRALDVVVAQFGDIESGNDPQDPPPELLDELDTLKVPDGEAPAAAAPAAEPEPEPEPEPESGGSRGQAPGDFTDEEFEHLLDTLDEGDRARVEEAAASDEITDDEFENLLDDLHGRGRHGGVPEKTAESGGEQDEAGDTPVTEDEASGDDEIEEEEFEALLDNLYGKGAAPGRSGAPTQAGGGESGQAAADKEPAPAPKAREAKPEAAKPQAARSDAPASGTDKGGAKGSDGSQDKAAASGQSGGGGQGGGGQGGGKQGGKGADGGGDGGNKVESSVRVDTSKLDEIMNLVGELVLVRNRLTTLRGLLDDDRMTQAVSDLELVTSDLQGAVMQTRMQPIKKVFGRFPRVIRDLARQLEKEVRLETHGEDTDLDKNMVEALSDPMIHLVRNAVDHGVEYPDEREAAGKPREGKVTLSAEQEGDHILLIIADDGRGMDPDKLRDLAVKKGVMDTESAARLDDKEAFNLIFHPGFSSKENISDVSGRGVGMDVVKNSLSKLNGTVDIDSELGKGTVMKIQLPLTLAILPTLMVKVSGRKFALPMSVVREIFELQGQRTNVVNNRLVVMVRNKAMPLFFLERWMNRSGDPVPRTEKQIPRNVSAEGEEDERQVVTVILGNQAVGFVVDEVIGLEEVVIKPLGALLHGLPGLAGSTITGDGQISLIVDIPSLIKAYGKRL